MNKNTFTLENLSLNYSDEGTGAPIVLIHGFVGSNSYWDKIIPNLIKDYRVIAPDLPGHGKSTFSNENLSMESIADNLKKLLDHLNIKKVTMFGHSLGGYITLAFAEKYSDRLNGFSLIHSTAFPDSEEAKKGRLANIEKVKEHGVQPLVDGLVLKLFSKANFEKNTVEVEVTKEIGYLTSPEGATLALGAMRNRPDRNDILENTLLPVLLLAGEQDQIIPVEKTLSIKKDNIIHSLLKNTGHMSMYEAPEELVLEIKNFLKS